MYKNIFDSHAHYDDSQFDNDRDDFLEVLPSLGVSDVVNCGCDLKSSLMSISLAEKYSYFHCALGIHPTSITEQSDEELNKITALLDKPECVAVGEIGLDYHYDFIPRERQIYFFRKQLELSLEKDLPVIIHDREAHEDTLNLLKEYKPRGVLHCFSGSTEMAKEILKLGMYIGLGGAVTFKNARKPLQVAEMVPDDRLLVETDCPYMAPVPMRGKRCSSDMIAFTAEKLAEIRKITPQELLDITNRNAACLFGINR